MSSSSSPIDIASPNKRYGSNSPRNQTSNLTSALQQAGPGPSPAPTANTRQNTVESRPSATRKDSLTVPNGGFNGATGPMSVDGKPRRESALGSFRPGMSWGAMSMGSYIQDDIMMGGLSPSMNSPSFHSTSYLPKMEANFWNNLKCCDTTFSNLHELVSHFEDVHKQAGSNFPSGSMGGGLPRRKSSSTNPADWRAQNQVRGFQPVSDAKTNGISRFAQPFVRKPSAFSIQDMDTIGEMELDDGTTMQGQGFDQFSQQASHYSNESTPQMQQAFPNMQSLDGRGFRSSQSSSPINTNQQTNFGNDLFSGLNSSTYGAASQQQDQSSQQPYNGSQNFSQINTQDTGFEQQYNSNAVPFNSQMLQRLDTEFGNMNFSRNNDMVELCINEPAKNLYSADGGFNSQQYPHFNFANNENTVTNNSDENAQKLQAHRLATGLGKQPTEEERPFKCPVIGCEKAYKNANGLRYHEKHGHSNQKLKDNGDGSFSIVDPITSIPYPGTVGMEKEKPYRCEVCGKRYKNLNGLKYHRNHSPPCNPDYNMSNVPNLEGANIDAEAVY